MPLRLTNIVYSGTIGERIDPKHLADICEQISYSPKFPSGCHIKGYKHPITLYTSGKFIMPGMKTFEEAEDCYQWLKDLLRPYLKSPDFSELSIANIVCESQLGYAVNMNRLWLTLTSQDLDVLYELESFPGMIVRSEKATFNVFSNGRFMILGCRSIEDAEESDAFFKRVCEEARV